MVFIPLVILSLILIPESLGLPYGRELSFILILTVPVVLILYEKIIKNREIFIPKQISLFFGLFFLFSIISSFFSLNKSQSFRYLMLYFALFMTFISVVNYKKGFTRAIKPVIFGLSVLFIIYSALIQIFIYRDWFFLIPDTGFQFVYSKFGSHNHLGDFLVLSLVLTFYCLVKEKRKIYYVSLAFFLPFFLLSYSRTAYISLAAAVILLLVHFLKSKKLRVRSWLSALIILSILTAFTFSLITVRESKFIPFLSSGNELLIKNFNLNDKYFRAKRIEYLNQAMSSFKERPILGVGPGNFNLASKKYTSNRQWTFSSHNLFLDILAENGLMAFIFLILFFITLFKNMKEFNEFSAIFIAMLISFQTDYIFAIYSYFFLFFVLMGLVYTKQTK